MNQSAEINSLRAQLRRARRRLRVAEGIIEDMELALKRTSDALARCMNLRKGNNNEQDPTEST